MTTREEEDAIDCLCRVIDAANKHVQYLAAGLVQPDFAMAQVLETAQQWLGEVES